MTIVNISDIEDIVLAKHEIDTNNPNQKGRSNLNEFMNTYCILNDTLILNDVIIPFNYLELFEHKYLFVSDNQNTENITKFLQKIKYNFDNLIEINNYTEYMNSNIYLFIHNNKYYKIP